MTSPFAPLDPAGALPASPSAGAVALAHWGVIRAAGADAVAFLQGQLTNDVTTLTATEARLAGFCSAKGRLQASFIVWKDGAGDVLLACSASVLPATLKRLSMFVLRAKCKLTDATAEVPLWGEVGPDAAASGPAVWQKGATSIRLPDAAGLSRGLRLAPPASGAETLSADDWRWLEVQSGVATIEAATVDRFVPQMLNYELLGGVDFRKGCYPGQEVVARSQYRGTLKRRSFLFDVDAAASAGDELWHPDDPAQPAGLVVNAAPQPRAASIPSGAGTTTHAVLAEVKLAALASGVLRLGGVDGAPLRRRDLPYAVPIDAA